MAFDLLTFLSRALGGFDVAGIDAKAQAWLTEKGSEYPDLKERADALAAWLGATLNEASPELDPEQMRGTLLGIAQDVVRGTSGVNYDSWRGIG